MLEYIYDQHYKMVGLKASIRPSAGVVSKNRAPRGACVSDALCQPYANVIRFTIPHLGVRENTLKTPSFTRINWGEYMHR
jgi:hypothetical protein